MNNDIDLSFLNDMQIFNRRGNEESIGKFETFWKAAAIVIELDEGYWAHWRRHCSGNVDTASNVSYAPIAMSIPKLIKKTSP